MLSAILGVFIGYTAGFSLHMLVSHFVEKHRRKQRLERLEKFLESMPLVTIAPAETTKPDSLN